jgi:drug/metabolite transporter (DMT)-like permease
MKTKQVRANVLLFITALIWGVAFVEQRIAVRFIGAFTFSAIRFAIGALSMLPLLFYFQKKPGEEGSANNVSLKSTLPVGLLLGGVLFFAATLQQMGLYTTTAGKAGFITDLYIIFVPLIEVIFGRRLNKTIWICAPMAAVGLYLISVTDKFTMSSGDIMVLIGSVLWAVHILLIDRFSKSYNPIRLSLIQYLLTAVLSLFVALAIEKTSFYAILQAAGPIIYTGVFSVGIAYTLQIFGQRYAKASHAAIILSMESVISCIAGVLFLNERLGAREIIGCCIMAAAMVLTQCGSFGKKLLARRSDLN